MAPGAQAFPALERTQLEVVSSDDPTSVRTLAARPAPALPVASRRSRPREVMLAPGGQIDKYELRRSLGQGTFGLVFRAYDTVLEREVALKVLHPSHVANDDILQRFLREARTSARIAHPGVVTVLDAGTVQTASGDTAYITMELLGGESLTQRLQRRGVMTVPDALEIIRQVASALDAAHRADVLHRDLKPDNIYLVPDPAMPSGERVKVLDFGLAKLGNHGHTRANMVFGTPKYMSPEQCRSASQIDARSDLYALGCILFELVTGRPPFDGDLRQLFDRHRHARPPRVRELVPELPAALDDLVHRMLAKAPDHRPATMAVLQRELAAVREAATAPPRFLPAPLPSFAPAGPLPPTPMPLARGSGRIWDHGETSQAEMLVPPTAAAVALPRIRRAGPRRWALIAGAIAFVIAAAATAAATAGPEPARPARPAILPAAP